MSDKRRILLIDNDPELLETLSEILSIEGYQVSTATSLKEARLILQSVPIQVIVTDLRATDDRDDNDYSGLIFARNVAPAIPKIILSRWLEWSAIRKALSPTSDDGPPPAVDFVSKQEGAKGLLRAVQSAFDRHVAFNVAQFKIGGALTSDDDAVYIPRQAEREVIESLRRMDYLLIIEPRQQGKTSLINYLLRCPDLPDTHLVYVDVATVDRSSRENWYESLYARIIDQLERILPGSPWPKPPKSSVEWRSCLSALALKFQSVGQSLVIALDEIGSTLPEATEFFSVLRDVFNSRQAEPHFKHITFLLAGVFHPRDLVKEKNISPFNVARRVRLKDFTLEQTRSLVGGFSSGEQLDILTARVYYWVSGQPYLTQQLCAYLTPESTAADVDRAVQRLQREDENHLAPLLGRIRADMTLNTYLARISTGERIRFAPSENESQAKLQLLGILKPDSDGYCIFRCRVYEQSFAGIAERPAQETSPGQSVLNRPNGVKIDNPAAPITEGSGKLVILFLAADPSDAARLRSAQELREIEEKLRLARMRDKFDLRQRMSVRPIDISQAILDESPSIIHFSGHGTGAGELCFEDEMGRAKAVAPEALGALFELVSEQVDCVLMNACYSVRQAEAIAKQIRYVIGMDKYINDRAAISFAIGFYQALGAGKPIDEAYKFGCVQIGLQGFPQDAATPVLLKGLAH